MSLPSQARAQWSRLKNERDFHRMHHRRVMQEKDSLVRDMKRLKAVRVLLLPPCAFADPGRPQHHDRLAPTVDALKGKYEQAMKDKMLVVLERDKLRSKARASCRPLCAQL